jgi:hypothetical protein
MVLGLRNDAMPAHAFMNGNPLSAIVDLISISLATLTKPHLFAHVAPWHRVPAALPCEVSIAGDSSQLKESEEENLLLQAAMDSRHWRPEGKNADALYWQLGVRLSAAISPTSFPDRRA